MVKANRELVEEDGSGQRFRLATFIPMNTPSSTRMTIPTSSTLPIPAMIPPLAWTSAASGTSSEMIVCMSPNGMRSERVAQRLAILVVDLITLFEGTTLDLAHCPIRLPELAEPYREAAADGAAGAGRPGVARLVRRHPIRASCHEVRTVLYQKTVSS